MRTDDLRNLRSIPHRIGPNPHVSAQFDQEAGRSELDDLRAAIRAASQTDGRAESAFRAEVVPPGRGGSITFGDSRDDSRGRVERGHTMVVLNR